MWLARSVIEAYSAAARPLRMHLMSRCRHSAHAVASRRLVVSSDGDAEVKLRQTEGCCAAIWCILGAPAKADPDHHAAQLATDYTRATDICDFEDARFIGLDGDSVVRHDELVWCQCQEPM